MSEKRRQHPLIVQRPVGKTRRLSDVIAQNELPLSAIAKVLKRELREQYAA